MTWGNPDGSTYGKVYLRLLAVGDIRAKVHREVHPLLARAVDDLTDAGLKIVALDASADGRTFTLDVDGVPAEKVATALAAYGFAPLDDADGYGWPGTVEALHAAAAAVESAPETPPVAPVPDAPVGDAYHGLIAAREVGLGDHGDDVVFLQHVYGQEPTGVFDETLETAIAEWQRRHNLRPTGRGDRRVWQFMFPRTQPRPQSGDAGWRAKIVTSALAAKGWIEAPTVIYGVRVARAVRTAQIERNLRPTGKVERAEWSRMVAWPWP